MVLSFAFCATFAFAQTANKTAVPSKAAVNAAPNAEKSIVEQQAGYTGSIFTKDDEIFVCDFSVADQGYTTGTVGAGEMVNGTTITQHAQTAPHSRWYRLPNNNLNDLQNNTFLQNNYPASSNEQIWGWDYLISGSDVYTPFGSETPEQGIMIMTMMDQIAQWGGTGNSGAFDAYIKFGPISTVGEDHVRVRFYQFFRRFNNDKCWIDYSTDGTTWSGVEINVRSVDFGPNAMTRGWRTQTMPDVLGNKQNVYFRLRWECSSAAGGAYGYWWFVDDFKVLPTLPNELTVKTANYFEGFYQTMPQNLNLPIVWASQIVNDGYLAQTNVTGKVYHYDGNGNSNLLVSQNIYTVGPDASVTRTIVIDPLGWYDSLATYHGEAYNQGAFVTGTSASLPTSTLGKHHWFSDINTDHYTTHIGDSVTFDTMRYDVNWENNDGHQMGVWARDHGVIRSLSYQAYGAIRTEGSSTIVSDDPDETQWNKADYGTFVTYVTGNTVPTDAQGRPWRVLGMEMVASTYPGMQAFGSRITPILWQDVFDSVGQLAGWNAINTGAVTYTVQQSDVIATEILADTNSSTRMTYETPGNYPVIRIMFPNQPEMQSKFSYRVGYVLDEEADFTVATSSNYFYNEQGEVTRFYEEPGMESYGHALPASNRYSILVRDPFDGYVRYPSSSQYPMIRLLVGPAYYVPKVQISFQCEDENTGAFADGDYNVLCGTTDSVVVGSAASYYVFPEPGYEIDQLTLNGEAIDYEAREDGDGNPYYIVELVVPSTNCTLYCSFKEGHVSIDPVANVSMKLQPNPATSNVNVVMKGVTGNVNMALIDMSGRVVSTSQFNAENGTNINVSNLAKGAYFVRITNSKFSKIEKLIVR